MLKKIFVSSCNLRIGLLGHFQTSIESFNVQFRTLQLTLVDRLTVSSFRDFGGQLFSRARKRRDAGICSHKDHGTCFPRYWTTPSSVAIWQK